MKKVIKSITACALATACICGGISISSNSTEKVGAYEHNPVSYSGYTYQVVDHCVLCGTSLYQEYYQGRKTRLVWAEHRYQH